MCLLYEQTFSVPFPQVDGLTPTTAEGILAKLTQQIRYLLLQLGSWGSVTEREGDGLNTVLLIVKQVAVKYVIARVYEVWKKWKTLMEICLFDLSLRQIVV